MLKYSSWTGNNMVRKSALEKALESGCVSHRNHRYAFFLRLAYEEIILRQYSRYLIFDVLVNSNQCFLNKLWNCLFSLHDFMVCDNIIFS